MAMRAESPLQLLTPKNHGDAAWVYLASLGGGFVGDDALSLDVELEEHASLFLSSQASTKAYRGSDSRFHLDARLARGATLLAWPEPVTCFAGASLRQEQRLSLAADASLLFVDAFTAGRIARDERWAFERLEARLHVDVDGAPWLREGLVLSAALGGPLAARLERLDAFATVVLCGPRFTTAAQQLAERIATARPDEAVLVSASPRERGLLVRVAAPDVEALQRRLQRLLARLVLDVLQDAPPSPFGGRLRAPEE